MHTTENESYRPRYSVIVKCGQYSRGYIVRAKSPADLLRKLSEKISPLNSAEISYAEILLDSDEID